MVFGRLVAGKEVVKEIEDLETDKKDRPLQEIRIMNCGELVLKKGTKSEKKEKKVN